jgi:hypothetical protein
MAAVRWIVQGAVVLVSLCSGQRNFMPIINRDAKTGARFFCLKS